MFAPSVFQRRQPQDGAHVVYHQPATEQEVDDARAALAACPVAAIRVDKDAITTTTETTRAETTRSSTPVPVHRRVTTRFSSDFCMRI